MKKVLTGVLAVMLVIGCIGKFSLTKKLYDFNTNVGEKWVNELVFLGLIILPAYGLATLGDAIIFNSVEFWTGKNPIVRNADDKIQKLVDIDNKQVVMTYMPTSDSIKVNSFTSYRPESMFTLTKNASGVLVMNKQGDVVYTSRTDDRGGIAVSNAQGDVLRYFTPDEVAAAR